MAGATTLTNTDSLSYCYQLAEIPRSGGRGNVKLPAILSVREHSALIHHQPQRFDLPLVQAQGAQVGNPLLGNQIEDVLPRSSKSHSEPAGASFD